jgi:hypothetical protein
MRTQKSLFFKTYTRTVSVHYAENMTMQWRKEECPKESLTQASFHVSVSPEYPIEAISNFYENSQRYLFIASVNDTADKLITGTGVTTFFSFIAGVVDTGD